jgi:fructose-1,6-bisphosphatase I
MAAAEGDLPRPPDDLGAVLSGWAGDDPSRSNLAQTVVGLAAGARDLAAILARGPLAGDLTATTGANNADGDVQNTIDVVANGVFISALKHAPVAFVASEESCAPIALREGGALAVAIDPLDGSDHVGVNLTVGAIFSILPAAQTALESFLRPCADQLAAGYFLFASSTLLVLTLGDGVDMYVLDPDDQRFKRAAAGLRVPDLAADIAINMSNRRFWPAPICTFVDDCLAGADGPRGVECYTRWLAVLVAEAHRILLRGGAYLYPADARPGFEHGRLRLIYEAAPIAMLMEQAGGAATDGQARILARTPAALHERTPLVFGSALHVAAIRQYHVDPAFVQTLAPLFQQRGLFKS